MEDAKKKTEGSFFFENLKSIRDFLGITNLELSERCGMPPTSITEVLKRTSGYPSMGTAIKLAKGLGVTLDRLIANPAEERQRVVVYKCKKKYKS